MGDHAKFSPSSAHRWMRCPGSARLEADLPDVETEYSRAGTEAHDVAATCLAGGYDAAQARRLDDATADAVQVYLDAVRVTQLLGDGVLKIEQRVFWTPDVYGTADAIVFSPVHRTLDVFDYKNGAGVFVDVIGNEQARIYGLGALRDLTTPGAMPPVDVVHNHIVQPNCSGKPWRTEVLTVDELRAFGREVDAAVALAKRPDAPLVPGAKQCAFCKAKATCPALRALAVQSAQHAFDDAPVRKAPEPAQLTAEQLGDLLPRFDVVESWIAAVRAEAFNRVRGGATVPGHKLVAKKSRRDWLDATAAADMLRSLGVDPFTEPKMVSPAEAEWRLGRKRKALVAPLAAKQPAGLSLVGEDDPRPAVELGAAFDVLDDSNDGESSDE